LSFESIDQLQKTLADTIFEHTKDKKKAAGRALGTLVELITFYTLQTFQLGKHLAIERSVPEFANPAISHKVEFSLHPIRRVHASVTIQAPKLPLTASKLQKHFPFLEQRARRSDQLLDANLVKRNACLLSESGDDIVLAYLDGYHQEEATVSISELAQEPFAIFECKRVGVEEGMKKGPQAIEKAKQGAYVARSVSALQKIRMRNSEFQGFLEQPNGETVQGPYSELLRNVIDGSAMVDPTGVILTVGVASNHGNWFTSDNPNKEMRVLAQSYDWLLFLTDQGLSKFIRELLYEPVSEYLAASEAFRASYTKDKKDNRFTKVQIQLSADLALRRYFAEHQTEVESWFNVISPNNGTIEGLKTDLHKMAQRNRLETQ